MRRGGLGPYDLAGRGDVSAGGKGGVGGATVHMMCLSRARVLAPDVRVLIVAPAAVDTGFVLGRDSAAIEKQAAGTPLRVLVHPDDVAVAIIGTVTHLRVATGTVITVDGGKPL